MRSANKFIERHGRVFSETFSVYLERCPVRPENFNEKGRILIGPENGSKKINFKNEINISMLKFFQNLVYFLGIQSPVPVTCTHCQLLSNQPDFTCKIELECNSSESRFFA